jgi:hypothetical protein
MSHSIICRGNIQYADTFLVPRLSTSRITSFKFQFVRSISICLQIEWNLVLMRGVIVSVQMHCGGNSKTLCNFFPNQLQNGYECTENPVLFNLAHSRETSQKKFEKTLLKITRHFMKLVRKQRDCA